MPEVLFSIIIPTYNRGQLINKAIDSVLAQTYINLELIIVDDGSTDNTKSVIDAYIDPRIKYLYKQNEERGVARNTGMEIAEGDYITFLDSDDMLYPNHLMHALSKLKEFSFPEFYRQAYEIKDSSGNVLFRNNQLKGNANEFILKGNYFSCIGVFLKKELTKQTKFNPDRSLCPSEDWDYWLRLSVRYKFYYDNTVTSVMLQHSERSLCQFNERKTRIAISSLIKSLKSDSVFMEKRAKSLNQIKAQMYSLLCLNKVLNRKQIGLWKDIFKTLKLSKKELFKRRSVAIMKYFLINLMH